MSDLEQTRGPMTSAEFEALSPYDRGFVVYLCGARKDQPNVPDESNPYPPGSSEAAAWDRGAWSAYLGVLDGEE